MGKNVSAMLLSSGVLLSGAAFAQDTYVGRVAPWVGGGYALTVGQGAADIFHPPADLVFEDTGPNFQF